VLSSSLRESVVKLSVVNGDIVDRVAERAWPHSMHQADRSRPPGCASAPGTRLDKVSKCNLKNEAKINKANPGIIKWVRYHRLGLMLGLYNKRDAKFQFGLKKEVKRPWQFQKRLY
jgi:hypothetical protein